MSVKIQVVFNNFDKIAAAFPAATQDIVTRAGLMVETHAKDSMNGAKHGLMYGTHQASAKYEPPAIITGKLKNSIRARRAGQFTVDVGPSADYGIYLEFGTRNMAPRPFMKPAAKFVMPLYVRDLRMLEARLR